jgi:para-nitrobenzyl esterase
VASSTALATSTTLVDTAFGSLKCENIGKQSRQCLSIPFAAPPVGNLRWNPPAPPAAWSGIRDATSASVKPICLQANKAPKSGSTDEDCLYLNVYAPRNPTSSGSGHPVVVWIHGGSYQNGSPQNASGLVDLAGDIVFVGVNYRMGWTGFLGANELRALDPAGSTGNAGIQDQRFAMEWVRKHIDAFGGDPSKITIDGCSAGAGSVAVHVTSPKAWPYFDQAGAQSGMVAAWNSLPMAQAQTFFDLFATAAGCSHNSSSVACMMPKNATELATAVSNKQCLLGHKSPALATCSLPGVVCVFS